MDPLKAVSTRKTPQSQPIPGSGQVKNSAGGHAWKVDRWQQLDRFLILGTQGGTYYITEQQLTINNAKSLLECLDEDGVRAVSRIVEISDAGRAPKNRQAVFALACAASHENEATRAAALAALPKVARYSTDLYLFTEYVQQFRGWGRGLRRAVARWYEDRNVDALAYQAIKYAQRNGVSHRDNLRRAHPTGLDAGHKTVYDYMCGRVTPEAISGIPLLVGAEAIKGATTVAQAADLVHQYGLPWEAVPDQFRKAEVWQAILDGGMPLGAMLRQLPTLTRLGVITNSNSYMNLVRDQLTDSDALRKARIHPLNVLFAQRTYASGRSFQGTATWSPVPKIIDAMSDAFYASFGNVVPADKRTLQALDVSGSMGTGIAGNPVISCRDASAAMALVTAATEPSWEMIGFTSGGNTWSGGHGSRWGGGVQPLTISPKQRLDDVIRTISGLPFGGTDCSLPMQWAQAHGKEFDTFVVYTDSETWHGSIHPSQALREYRDKMGIDARLVVVGMAANEFSIADPRDGGMLDVVGFDVAAPNIISSFSRGEF